MNGNVTSQGVSSLRGRIVYPPVPFCSFMSWYVIATPRHQEKVVKQVLDKYPVKGIYGGVKIISFVPSCPFTR